MSARKWFFKARLDGGAGLTAVVPAGADTDPVKAYPTGNATGIGPTQTFAAVEAADKIALQPQVPLPDAGLRLGQLRRQRGRARGPILLRQRRQWRRRGRPELLGRPGSPRPTRRG